MKLHHVIEAQQFDPATLAELFQVTEKMEGVVAEGGVLDYQKRVMATLFYEPSTRTRFSFETAMHRLGGRVISTENAAEFSSVAKGETLEDSIRIVSNYADTAEDGCIAYDYAIDVFEPGVIRIFEIWRDQAALEAHFKAPHMAQWRAAWPSFGVSDRKLFAYEGRTVRSLAYLLSKYRDVKIHFVAPPLLKMKQDILDHLREHHVWFTEETELEKVLPEVDVVYQTRIQKERFGDRSADYERCRGVYVINQASLRLMKPNAIVMYPLPRLDEITMEVDEDPRAAYFRQAQNGLYVRMALLTMTLG